MNLQEIMKQWRDDVLTVASTDRKIPNSTKEYTPEEDEIMHDKWIRYEPDTNFVFMKTTGFKKYMTSQTQTSLVNSLQFLGYINKRFYAGTDYKGGVHTCYLFDLSKSFAPTRDPKTVISKVALQKKRSYLKKKHGGDVTKIAQELDEWAKDYGREKERFRVKERIKRRDARYEALEQRVRELEARLGVEPPEKKQEASSKREKMQAVTDYIAQYKPNIRSEITRVKMDEESGLPTRQTATYDPADHGLETLGRYIESVRLDGTNRKKQLHLHTVPLKHYLTTHNEHRKLKYDTRYTHSQSTKIHSLPTASSLYCAVFNLLASSKNDGG